MSVDERRRLLENIAVTRDKPSAASSSASTASTVGKRARVGPALSARLYAVFTSADATASATE